MKRSRAARALPLARFICKSSGASGINIVIGTIKKVLRLDPYQGEILSPCIIITLRINFEPEGAPMMKKTLFALLAATALGTTIGTTFSTTVQAAAFSDNEGHFLVRGRALVVAPDESSSIEPIGGRVSISTTTVPEFDVSYFFTNNIAAELIAAVTPHNISAKDTSLGGVNAGKVWLLPPHIDTPVSRHQL
jgi:hypothetical protein